MHRLRVLLQISLIDAGTLPLVATPATYKWIDERGVVNYGNAPPAAGGQVKRLDGDAFRERARRRMPLTVVPTAVSRSRASAAP